jgi:hypothetical protein
MPHNSFNGKWKLNLPASTLPFAPPRSVILDIAVDGDNICITENSVDAAGQAETVTIEARFDNQIYPVTGSAIADGFAIERLDERTWRAHGTKAGSLVFTETVMLADDGNSIREDAETTLADGSRAPAVLIYERQQSPASPRSSSPSPASPG